MPHVHFPGRVWIHLQAVKGGFILGQFRFEQASIGPFLLPTNLVDFGLLFDHNVLSFGVNWSNIQVLMKTAPQINSSEVSHGVRCSAEVIVGFQQENGFSG